MAKFFFNLSYLYLTCTWTQNLRYKYKYIHKYKYKYEGVLPQRMHDTTLPSNQPPPRRFLHPPVIMT